MSRKQVTDEQIDIFRRAIAELSSLPILPGENEAALRRAEIAGMESQLASLESDRALSENFAQILAPVHSASRLEPQSEEELEAFFDQVRAEVHAERKAIPHTADDWAMEFDAWVASHTDGDLLPESAFTRESFYHAEE